MSGSRHLAACLRGSAARFGAFGHSLVFAFLRAGVARVRTDQAESVRELASSSKERHAGLAQSGTVGAQRDAVSERRVALSGAFLGTGFTFGHAGGECVDELLGSVVYECHFGLFGSVRRLADSIQPVPSRRWRVNHHEARCGLRHQQVAT